MAQQPRSGSGARDRTSTPSESELTGATPISPESTHAGARIKAVEDAVGEIKTDIRDIRNWLIGAFILLASMAIGGYLLTENKIEKLNEKVDKLGTLVTRMETKLEDLLVHIPPVPTLPPQKR